MAHFAADPPGGDGDVGPATTGGGAASRFTVVSPERLAGWVQRFSTAHGGGSALRVDGGVLVEAPDGARALLAPPWPDDGRPGSGADDLQRLESVALQSRSYAVVLVRRGGYALGLGRDGLLLAHKTGTRYLQSRTAAGGGSQQRFARRRANQADALVEAVAAAAAGLFADAGMAEYLVLGGDKALCRLVMGEPAARPLTALATLPFLDVPDPRLAVLAQAAKDARSIRVSIWDSAG
jgi:hypothetical protein